MSLADALWVLVMDGYAEEFTFEQWALLSYLSRPKGKRP